VRVVRGLRAGGAAGRRAGIAIVALCASITACTSELGGRASFPLVTRGDPYGHEQVVAHVDEQRCHYGLLVFFAWGEDENHEALVTDLLEKYDGDAIVNAELTFTFVPAILYTQNCARIVGEVVRKGHVAGQRNARSPAPAKEDP
jgi:hypothetical protein